MDIDVDEFSFIVGVFYEFVYFGYGYSVLSIVSLVVLFGCFGVLLLLMDYFVLYVDVWCLVDEFLCWLEICYFGWFVVFLFYDFFDSRGDMIVFMEVEFFV